MVARPKSGARFTSAPERDGDFEPIFEDEIRRRQEVFQVGGERRLRFETLAIGAPITAAFVGILLAERGGIFAEARSAGADGADGARSAGGLRPADSRTGSHGELPALPGIDAGSMAAAPGDVAATGLAASPALTANLGHIGGEATATDIPIAGTSGGLSVGAAFHAGPEVSFSFTGLHAPLFTEPADFVGGGGAPGLDPIGIRVEGGPGDDVIFGTDRADYLAGGGGDDEIHGLAGNDRLFGQEGNDRLYGDAGDDFLDGGPGHDRLHGGSGDDRLFGGSGDDGLFGGSGRDELDGGPGDDILDGGTGADRMSGGPGDDDLVIDNIHDLPFGDGSSVTELGDNTLLVGDTFAAHLLQESGEEHATFVFSENFGHDLPSGIAAHTRLVGQQTAIRPDEDVGDIRNITLEGAAHHDVVGDSRGNVIDGNGGDNALHGMAGDDILRGGAGADRLVGGGGDDILRGNGGDDRLLGGGGDDRLFGGGGDDILSGGSGEDRLEGGAGDDTYLIGLNDSAVDTVFDHDGVNQIRLDGVDGEAIQTALVDDHLRILADQNTVAVVEDYLGNEEAFAGIDVGDGPMAVADLMIETGDDDPDEPDDDESQPGDDLLRDFLGSATLVGSEGVDALEGTSGSDWLAGLAGDDHLRGGAGDDLLEGGAGSDLLEGGAGDDQYLFRPDDFGLNVIRDAEGSNFAELDGFAGMEIRGIGHGGDLAVLADNARLFTVEDHFANEDAFAGIKVGDQFVETEELFT